MSPFQPLSDLAYRSITIVSFVRRFLNRTRVTNSIKKTIVDWSSFPLRFADPALVRGVLHFGVLWLLQTATSAYRDMDILSLAVSS